MKAILAFHDISGHCLLFIIYCLKQTLLSLNQLVLSFCENVDKDEWMGIWCGRVGVWITFGKKVAQKKYLYA